MGLRLREFSFKLSQNWKVRARKKLNKPVAPPYIIAHPCTHKNKINHWTIIADKSSLERLLQICELAADHRHPTSGQKGESSDHHWLEKYPLQVTNHYDPLCQICRRIEHIEQKRSVVKCRCTTRKYSHDMQAARKCEGGHRDI